MSEAFSVRPCQPVGWAGGANIKLIGIAGDKNQFTELCEQHYQPRQTLDAEYIKELLTTTDKELLGDLVKIIDMVIYNDNDNKELVIIITKMIIFT